MPNISPLLSRLGLNEKEKAIFLSLSKIGTATVSSIARDAQITRTHVYDIVSALAKKGLVFEAESAGVKRYEAINHAGLLAHVVNRQKELQKLEKDLAQAASDFASLRKGEVQKTKVRFYDGVEGMKQVYEEVRADLKKMEKKELFTIWPVEALEKTYSFFYQNKMNIDMQGLIKRDIMFESKMADLYIERYARSQTEHHYKFWPKEKGEFPTDALCWADKVAYTDVVGHPSSIVIENASVAETFRMYFWQMWNNL